MLLLSSKRIVCIKTLKILCFCILFCLLYFSSLGNEANWFQGINMTIKGKVTDASNGETIRGVNVIVAGTTRGTTTNATGEFEIVVDQKNAELEFSAVNYTTQRVKVEQQQVIDVSLQIKANSLGEVVVVGYGKQKRATLTGSVSEVRGSDLVKSPSPNVANNLAGRVTGVITSNNSGEPGDDGPTLLIRGLNTFSGATSPLIVIDGVANRPGGFERLNPNDIESITVLKDASAAIYGSQAANGVILVTTKRGRSGQTQVSFTYNQGFNSWTKFPRMTSSFEFATLLNEEKKYNNEDPVFTEEELQKFRNGSDLINYPNTNWVKEVAKDVTLQNSSNLSLSGGTDKVKYYGSFGRLQQDGQFKSSSTYKYTQYNLSLNLDFQVIDNLKISFENQLRYSERNGPPGATARSLPGGYGSDGTDNLFFGLLFSLPTQVARYPDGRLGSTNPVTHSNPIARTSGLAGSSSFKNMFALNTLRYRLDLPQIGKGVFVDGFVSADLENSDTKDFGKSWSAYSYDKSTNTYTEIKQTASAEGLASLEQSAYNRSVFTLNTKLNYQRTLNEKHTINSFIAYEQQQYKDRYFFAGRRNFVTDNIDELNYGSPVNATNGGGSTNTARRNYFGRVNYSYSDKYIVEVQARYDGSDKFSEDKRWGLFPSVSLGWKVAGETWAQALLRENELKLRASFGILGNDGIDPYQFLQFYNLNSSGYYLNGRQVPTLGPGVLPNPNFTWETAKSYNVGVDGSFLNKSFTYSFDAFLQKRSDILSYRNATVPNYTGLNLPIENIGKMENKGVEVLVNYRKQFKKLGFTTGVNLTYTRNKVLFFDEPESIPEYQKQTGKSLNNLTLYTADGLFQSQDDIDKYVSLYDYQIINPEQLRPGDVKFVDYNNDGVINALDRVRKDGNEQPNIVFGYTASLDWNGFDLSLLFQGQAGTKNYFYPLVSSTLNAYYFLYEGRSTPDRVTDQPTIAGANYARPAFQASTHPFFLRNTSFVRLKNAELGYSLLKLFGSKAKLTNARVYANGSNLLTFAKFNDIDPESMNRADGRGYPILRTINVGVQFTF
jgi:TonB-linked SusC/RagA family outer membrane protein